MMIDMNEMHGSGLTISCDDCSMHGTVACHDCVVTFLFSDETEHDSGDAMVLDLDQVRVVKLLGKAGLVPDLKYRVAG